MVLGFDNTYARDLEGAYIPSPPRGFPDPALMSYDRGLAAEIGLPPLEDADAARLYSGTVVPDDATPIAMAYAGHQFGGFTPQLGDGRAVLLGELVDPTGRRWDLQLKGSGPTRFSRGGDGLAAVGPVLREHLVSHAMHHLGVPSTRVLATVRTGAQVRRQTPLDGAVLARVGSSHLRVGTLEFFAARKDQAMVGRLVAYALSRHAPELADGPEPALALLKHVARRQAKLVTRWLGVGFVHGVMNTDNFTLSGETLDYGPCAFVDAYDPAAVFSSLDHGGRYALANQPRIAQWNLARMGETLLPLIDADIDLAVAKVQQVLADFASEFNALRTASMRAKLGLTGESADDAALMDELLAWMHATSQDHTRTFRDLATSLRTGTPHASDARFTAWHERWTTRLGAVEAVADAMDRVNPVYIPRNHLVEDALSAAEQGDMAPFERFLAVLERPFTEQPGAEAYAEAAPESFGCYTTFCGT